MSRRRIVVALLVALWPCAFGCAALLGIEDTTDERSSIGPDASRDRNAGGDGPATDGAPADGGADANIDGAAPCPGIHGPKMVKVTAGFCIDSTEVTRADYAAFIASSPSSAQAAECSFNTSYLPSGWPYPPDADLAIPAGVNWCDAVAYCKWAGKRLCGARGDGGAISVAQGSDPAVSEWMAACSRDGGTFPYGSSFQPTRCNGKANDAGRTLRVGQLSSCQGGDPGIFDMSGNAWEWDYSCVLDDAGRPAQCGQRGGSFTDDSNLLICSLTNYQDLDLKQESAGFRCCASAN